MIKLIRSNPPPELTTEQQTHLTNRFKETKSSVWNQTWLRKALLDCSNRKCAFCECSVAEESKYLEVEHFRSKDRYPDLVMEWSNLLPACKRCNGNKSNHDVISNPIVDPFSDDPKNHFGFRDYRLKEKSAVGGTTLDVLYLNDSDRLVLSRFRIGEAIHKQLEMLIELASSYRGNPSITLKNKISGGVACLLKQALPIAEYAATSATILLTEPLYETLKSMLKSDNIWDNSMDSLESQAITIKLDRI